MFEFQQNEPPGIGRFLSQGAVVGAALGFWLPVEGILSHPQNGYNWLYQVALPLFLLAGMGFGLVEGVILWACAHLSGRHLNAVRRAVLGIVVLVILLFIVSFLFPQPSGYHEEVPKPNYFFMIGFYIVFGAIFGLVIGSRFHPLRELIRGTDPAEDRAMTVMSGLFLRVSVVFALMEASLYFIWTEQGDFRSEDFTISLIASAHFVAATVIVFARMPFWMLLILGVAINSPIVFYITYVLTAQDNAVRVVGVTYLALWGSFVLSRLRNTGEFAPER